MSLLFLLIAAAATLAIFLTTAPGRKLLKRIGFRDYVPGAAPSGDLEYLRAACAGNLTEVDRRIAVERTRYPDQTEAEHYRRAIRKVMNEGRAGSSEADQPR